MSDPIRNPVFWGDVYIPALRAAMSGKATVTVVADSRLDMQAGDCEVEVRIVRIGKTRITRQFLRAAKVQAR